jgi:hypothetical protein
MMILGILAVVVVSVVSGLYLGYNWGWEDGFKVGYDT